jgi:hypothetical protein
VPAPRPAAPRDAGTVGRSGDREWLSDGLINSTRRDRKGIGVSVLTHLGVVVLVGASVITEVAPTPIVKEPTAVFLSPLSVAPPIQHKVDPPVAKPKPPSPTPTASAPVSSAPTPPLEAPPAPVEAPPQVLPEVPRPETTAIAQNVGTEIKLPDQPPNPGGISEEPVDDVDVNPGFVKQVQPKVPVGATGNVNVEVLVGTNGRVSRVRFQGDTPYRAQIEEAAMQCVFTPARRRGRPVAHWTLIQFRLETNTGTRR